jgi:hypothetical protein
MLSEKFLDTKLSSLFKTFKPFKLFKPSPLFSPALRRRMTGGGWNHWNIWNKCTRYSVRELLIGQNILRRYSPSMHNAN